MSSVQSVCDVAVGYASDPLLRVTMAVQMPIIGLVIVLITKVFIKARRDKLPPIHVNLKVKKVFFSV